MRADMLPRGAGGRGRLAGRRSASGLSLDRLILSGKASQRRQLPIENVLCLVLEQTNNPGGSSEPTRIDALQIEGCDRLGFFFSAFDGGGHLGDRHQGSRDLVQQLVGVFFFSERLSPRTRWPVHADRWSAIDRPTLTARERAKQEA
jgi:hypothetical protein